MKVTFGLNLDGIDIRPQTPLIGEVTVGPKGLIGILATRMGLPAPITPEIHRIAEFAGILESHDNGERFYSKSIQIDGFNTAKTLLNWRDAWIQAGWNGKCSDSASQRIKDMVNVCADTTESLSPGPADHFQEIITSLKQRKADLELTCITDKGYLPGYLQELMELLDAKYSPLPEEPQAPAKSDLGRLQRALADGKAVNLTQDGSISYIESISQQSAATRICQHLGENSFVIAENDTEPLDLALRYQGLPTFGASQQSTARAAL